MRVDAWATILNITSKV